MSRGRLICRGVVSAGVLAAAVVALPPAQAAPAQPPAREPEITIDPALALGDIASAYRAGPTADEVTVRVEAEGRVGTEVMTVRLDPAAGNGAIGAASALLELGVLRLWLGEGRLIALHASDPRSYYEAAYRGPITPDVLKALLPPLPVPALDLISAGDHARPIDLTPYGPGVVFAPASLAIHDASPILTITGRGVGTGVVIRSDAMTGRLRAVRLEPDSPLRRVLDLRFVPIDPGEPSSWKPDIAGRVRVNDLARLGVRPGDLTIGAPVPELALRDDAGALWRWQEAFRLNERDPAATPARLALVFVRVGQGEDVDRVSLADAAAGLAAVRSAAESLLRGDPSARASAVAAVVVGGSPEERPALDPAPSAPASLHAPDAAGTLDRFAPGAGAALVVLSAEGRLASVTRLDGASSLDPASLTIAAVEALRAARAP